MEENVQCDLRMSSFQVICFDGVLISRLCFANNILNVFVCSSDLNPVVKEEPVTDDDESETEMDVADTRSVGGWLDVHRFASMSVL